MTYLLKNGNGIALVMDGNIWKILDLKTILNWNEWDGVCMIEPHQVQNLLIK